MAPAGAWRWAYVLFRFGDGLGHAFLLLLPVTHYGLPAWGSAAAAAAMNLAAVPATLWWGRVMERSRARRRIATAGFAVAGASMALVALLPPFGLYLLGAALYGAFGVATAPAAGVLLLEGRPRGEWAAATAAFSRVSAVAYVAGTATAVAVGFGVSGGLGSFLGLDLPAVVVALLDPRLVLAAVAVASVAAAVVAWWSILPSSEAPPPPSPRFHAASMEAGQRRFDRPVFLLTRLRNVPRWSPRILEGPSGRLAYAIFVLFTASVMFFSAYPGVLATTLGLGTGLALLAQAPSHLATPLSYGSVHRAMGRHGDAVVLRRASVVRAAVFLLMMGVILVLGRGGYVVLLLLHAAAGVTFAFVQVSAPCLLAEHHPGGRGAGVGTFHAAMGLGTLVGSSASLLLLLVAPLWALYGVVAVLFAAGLAVGRGATTTEKSPSGSS